MILALTSAEMCFACVIRGWYVPEPLYVGDEQRQPCNTGAAVVITDGAMAARIQVRCQTICNTMPGGARLTKFAALPDTAVTRSGKAFSVTTTFGGQHACRCC